MKQEDQSLFFLMLSICVTLALSLIVHIMADEQIQRDRLRMDTITEQLSKTNRRINDLERRGRRLY